MTIDDQIARARELIARREEIDRQLAELFAGAKLTRKTPRRNVCSESGHTARLCSSKQIGTVAENVSVANN